MAEAAQPLTKRAKFRAHLIAVRQRREAVRVYAVVALSAEIALRQVRALASGSMQIELVGGLSRDMVRYLGLKPGEMRLV